MQALQRARGALYGLAIGDALGMPTQMLSRAEVVARWGPLLRGFEAAPPGHPIADGMPAGSVTDDTEQAVLLGRLLIRGHGEIDPREWANALAGWEKEMAARGSLDLLGPSTKRALEPDAERAFVTHLGAETLRDAGSWDATPLEPGDFAYVSGYGLVPAESGQVLADWAAALPEGVTLFMDPGPLAADIPEPVLGQVLARCDWLSGNAREAALLSGTEDPVQAGRQLRDRTTRGSVIVRDGAAGCLLIPRIDQVTRIPAPEVEAVDTTGAGDTHAGVFLAALADGLRPARAAHRANAAAALSVTKHGPATSPTRAELDTWMAAVVARKAKCSPGGPLTG